MVSAMKGNSEAVKLLLDRGADPNATSKVSIHIHRPPDEFAYNGLFDRVFVLFLPTTNFDFCFV